MSERSFILKVIRQTEERFGCICYAHLDSNTPKTNVWWSVCMNDYEAYMNKDNRTWFDKWYQEGKKRGIKILFCYCNPVESKLLGFAKEDNLILNI